MEIIGITGSDEYRATVAEILSYDLGVKRLSGYSSKDYNKLCNLISTGKEDYLIVAGPAIFSNEKREKRKFWMSKRHGDLTGLVNHKFYIADDADNTTEEDMPGVVVLKSPNKTAFYYRNRIMESLGYKKDDVRL